MEIKDLIGTIIALPITVYVVYAMIKAFVETDPSFGVYGWPILGALMVGVVAFLRNIGNQ